MKDNCYICNNKIEGEKIRIIQVNEEDDVHISSIIIADFCAECFNNSCDSKIKHFHDRQSIACLYCEDKVNISHQYFYLVHERSFDVINSKLIHYKCYNENIGIHTSEMPYVDTFRKKLAKSFSTNKTMAPSSMFVSPYVYEKLKDTLLKK